MNITNIIGKIADSRFVFVTETINYNCMNENFIKQLATLYPNREYTTFFGNLEQSGAGSYLVHIYNTSDLVNGKPRYSTGICLFGDYYPKKFGTRDGAFYSGNL